MAKTEWFRRTSWSNADRAEFTARLARSRSAGNRAQYLRIQAYHLALAHHHAAAIELLDRLFAEFPEHIELAQAHCQKAGSLAKLGQLDAAVQEYRVALQSERDFPSVRTDAWLELGWLVVERQLTQYYAEALEVLQEFRKEDGFQFPVTEYKYAAIQALLAEFRGEKARACEFARQALLQAARTTSGLQYHPRVGLVGSERNTFASRLRVLARGG